MDNITILVAKTALKNMMRKGWLDICTIKKVIELNGVIPNGEDLRKLEALHCIHFCDMPEELLKNLPSLIEKVVDSNIIELEHEFFGKAITIEA